jgi:hypothetical protein
MRADLAAAGFDIADFRDTTETVEAQRRNRERLLRCEMAPVAADMILGARAREMQVNSMRSTEEGRCRTLEG